MAFPKHVIDALLHNKQTLLLRVIKLNHRLLERQYVDERTKEIATHGLGRRLSFLAEGLEMIFEATPPDLEKATIRLAAKASLLLHAHVIHVFGSLDNLARIWVAEAKVTRADGTAVPETWLGFGPGNVLVRQSLPPAAREFLSEADQWYDYLENFRHSLAHRVPLYVPVNTLSNADKQVAEEIARELSTIDINSDYDRWSSTFRRQMYLGQFRPVMIHSYSEGSPLMFYHGQILNDVLTIAELADILLDTLDA